MKILALVKTRNEAGVIGVFCHSYLWTDGILVADGGSTDKTIEDTQKYDIVQARNYEEKLYRGGKWLYSPTGEKEKYQGGTWFNPSGKMTNFLLDWAEEEGADWVILDDCDCHPNYKLRENAKHFINIAETEGYTAIFAYRLHIYGYDKYFPDLNKPGQSLWAWKLNSGIRANPESIIGPGMCNIPSIATQLVLDHPYVLLHYAWPTEGVVSEKLEFYRTISNPETKHPLEYGGKLAPLPDYARRQK